MELYAFSLHFAAYVLLVFDAAVLLLYWGFMVREYASALFLYTPWSKGAAFMISL